MKRLLFPVILLVTAAAVVFAAPAIAGNWKVHFSISGYDGDLECAFTQAGDGLSGTCKGEKGPVEINGKVEGEKVTFRHKSEYEGEALTVIYSGKFESESKITGSVDVQPMAVSGDFTASKVE